MTNEPSPIYDDEIDLRAVALTLWKARKAIFIVTVVAAVAAFIVSFWILPPQYQATAYVFVGQPAVEFSKSLTDSGITISPTLPDLNAVVKLSTAPDLLENVLKDQAVITAIGNKKISISNMATAVAVGKDQLSLQITDTDPQRAALLANTWAEKVTVVVNATYGLGAFAQTLDSQVLQSQQNYNQNQAALEDALSKNQVDALNAQLQSKQADLKCVLNSTGQTMRVLDDLQVFEQGLNGVSGDAPLSLGNGLALTTLQQRSLTSQPCQLGSQTQSSSVSAPSVSVPSGPDFTVQIDSASFNGFTVSKALEATAQMRAGLQAQSTRLQGDQSRLEQEIPQLQMELENAKAQLTLFTKRRDQSQALYTDLLQTQQQVATVLEQSSKVASMSVQAVAPDKKSSPKVSMNTALAGMAGLIIVVFWVLATNWWRNSGNDEQ